MQKQFQQKARQHTKVYPIKQSVNNITEMMALTIIEDETYTREVREWDDKEGTWINVNITSTPFCSGDQLLAFVNSMGGTPLSELYVVYGKLVEVCQKRDLHIVRSLIGAYITSLEMQGCSITLLRVDDEMIELWDSPVLTPALRWGI